MGKLSDDFHELMVQSVLIQRFVRNDGYKDVFSEGVSYPCIIEHKVRPTTTQNGVATVTTAQVHLDPGPVVGPLDKVTFEGRSPKIINTGTDYDIEEPLEPYAIIINT